MNAPQYGYQPYPAQREGIAITTQYSVLTWLYAVLKPKVFLNGYEMPAWGWGRAVYPAQPGQYHVHVDPSVFAARAGPRRLHGRGAGPAFIELEYKAPLFTFSRGSLGPPPQRYNGVGVMIAIAAFVVLMFVLCAIVVVAAH